MSAADEPRWPAGSLVVQTRSSRDAALVLVTPERFDDGPWRYVVTYVGRPSLGRPTGGSSFYSDADDFRWPETAAEIAAAAQYRARERVLTLTAELAAATSDAEAMDRAVELMSAQREDTSS